MRRCDNAHQLKMVCRLRAYRPEDYVFAYESVTRGRGRFVARLVCGARAAGRVVVADADGAGNGFNEEGFCRLRITNSDRKRTVGLQPARR